MNVLGRRAIVGLLTLLVLVTIASWLIMAHAARSFADEIAQKLNGSIAMYVVERAPLIDDGVVDAAQLSALAQQAMIVNPMVEVYVLDPRGRLLWRRQDLQPATETIDLAPIRTFLTRQGGGPIYGTDPLQISHPRVFSAAEIRDAGRLAGYVYVVFGGDRATNPVETLTGSYILRAALLMLVALLALTALAAWGWTVYLTRPARELHARVLRLGEEFGCGTIDSGAQRARGLAEVRAVFEALADRLRAHVDALVEADRLRRELFTNVSHDLRTPLTAMRGYLDTIASESDRLPTQRRLEFVAIARRHCDRLRRLVDQLFALAQLDVAAVRLRPEDVSLAELAQDIVGKYQLPAEAAGVRLQLEVDPRVPTVTADVGLIETVLENLLDNALRHTPAGAEVVVAVSARDRDVCTTVRDAGSGIGADDLARVVRRYETGRGGRSGLGLAIVTRILELHGSRLELQSAPGTGTTAAFALPGRPAAIGSPPILAGSPDALGERSAALSA